MAIAMITKLKKCFKAFFECLKEIFAYYKDFYNDALNRAKTISTKDIYLKMLLAFLFPTACAVYCSFREGVGTLYMNVFLPVFFINALIILFGSLYHATGVFPILISFLTTMGTALQIYMLPVDDHASTEAKKFVVVLALGIVLGILALPLLKYLMTCNRNTDSLCVALTAVSVGIYLILIVVGNEVNSASAWLTIPVIGISVQLTEITKLIAFVTFAVALRKNNPSKRRWLPLMILCSHAIFLAAVNELGTLGVILIVFFIVRIIYAEKKRSVIKEALVIGTVGLVMLGVCFGIYKATAPKETAPSTEVETKTETDEEPKIKTEDIIPLAEFEKTVQNETVESEAQQEQTQDEEAQQPDEKAPDENVVQKLIRRASRIYPKLVNRFGVFLNTEKVDDQADYQITQAKRALLLTKWFVTPEGSLSALPEVKSDLIWVYVLVRMGMIIAMVILLSYFVMFSEVAIRIARDKTQLKQNEGVLALAFVSSISFQAVICAMSSVGAAPIVGLPLPFLSNGGSALTTTMIMCFFILYYLRNENDSSQNTTESEVRYK